MPITLEAYMKHLKEQGIVFTGPDKHPVLKISISEHGADPYNVLTQTGSNGAWCLVKMGPGDKIKIINITWMLKIYLFIRKIKLWRGKK